MQFQLNIYGSPWLSNASKEALAFAELAINSGHSIRKCFFYFDGVYVGLASQSPASDESDLLAGWHRLSDDGVPLFLCIAASTNRGVLNEDEAARNAAKIAPMADCFELTGLGQWAAGYQGSDQIITFK